MATLATLYPWSTDPALPVTDVTDFRDRQAVRAVIFDAHKVALIHVSKHGYYMLPGGGTDVEDLRAALQRELMEELGCSVIIEREIGTIVTYIERWRNKQVDTGYICRLDTQGGTLGRTDFEQAEGHKTVWAPSLAAAIALSESAATEAADGKTIRARDLIFMKAAQQLLGN